MNVARLVLSGFDDLHLFTSPTYEQDNGSFDFLLFL